MILVGISEFDFIRVCVQFRLEIVGCRLEIFVLEVFIWQILRSLKLMLMFGKYGSLGYEISGRENQLQ